MNLWKFEVQTKQWKKIQHYQVISNTYMVLLLCPSTWDGTLTLNEDDDMFKLDKLVIIFW